MGHLPEQPNPVANTLSLELHPQSYEDDVTAVKSDHKLSVSHIFVYAWPLLVNTVCTKKMDGRPNVWSINGLKLSGI